MLDLGDQVRLTAAVKDSTGALVDSTATINITRDSDQTTVGPFSPVHDPPGGVYNYHYDYTPAVAGRHVARWTGTAVPFAHEEIFYVEPSASLSFVSLSDIKAQLRETTSNDDDELRSYLLSACENIEGTCGPVAVRTFTTRLRGDARAMWLPDVPAVSLTSLTPVYPWSAPVATTDVTVNLSSGKVTRLDGWVFIGDYDAVYKAGRPIIPSSLSTGCKMVVQHLWNTRRGAGVIQAGGGELVTLPGWAYAIPARAAELISGFKEATFAA